MDGLNPLSSTIVYFIHIWATGNLHDECRQLLVWHKGVRSHKFFVVYSVERIFNPPRPSVEGQSPFNPSLIWNRSCYVCSRKLDVCQLRTDGWNRN